MSLCSYCLVCVPRILLLSSFLAHSHRTLLLLYSTTLVHRLCESLLRLGKLLGLQDLHNLLSSDEPISMAEVESLIRAKKLDTGETNSPVVLVLVLILRKR